MGKIEEKVRAENIPEIELSQEMIAAYEEELEAYFQHVKNCYLLRERRPISSVSFSAHVDMDK